MSEAFVFRHCETPIARCAVPAGTSRIEMLSPSWIRLDPDDMHWEPAQTMNEKLRCPDCGGLTSFVSLVLRGGRREVLA